MLVFGLFLAGLGVAVLAGAFDSDSDDEVTATENDDESETETERQTDTETDSTTETETETEQPSSSQVIQGDTQNDTLVGTGFGDLLLGYAGDDDLTGRDGHDDLLGGEGDDLIKGRGGLDFMVGGDGDDNMRGGQDSDTLLGSAGNDTLMGGEGDDFLSGADVTNRDLTDADYLQDPTTLPPYFYQVPSEPETNVLFGDDGNDILLLGEGDTGTGGAGSDMFDIGEWIDDPDNAPLITDFTSGEDLLVVRHPSDAAAPAVGLENAGQKEWHLTANGEMIARIQLDGGPPPQASDIIFLAVE